MLSEPMPSPLPGPTTDTTKGRAGVYQDAVANTDGIFLDFGRAR
jgi:hypothetical protein